MVVTRGKGGGGVVNIKGIQYMVKEDDVHLSGGQTMQHTDHISWQCTLETYITVLTNVTPTNLIKTKVPHTW